MNWTRFLAWPATLAWSLAALLLLLALAQALACGRRLRARRRLSASWHALWLLAWLALALLGAAAGLALRGWHGLADETPVLALQAHRNGDVAWTLELRFPDGGTRHAMLHGDAWRIEAIVLKWKLPAMLAGVPPLYRLDRLSGRYDDPAREAEAPRTVVDFNRAGSLDVALLRRQYAHWLPMVDTEYGSGVYLPLVDGGRYRVSLMRSGALVARAETDDDAR